MANNVNRQVNIYIQTGEAEKAYDRLIKKEQKLKDELQKATDPATIQRLQKEIDKLQEPISRAAKKMRNELQPSIQDIRRTLSMLNKELEKESPGTARFHELALQIQAANIQLKEAKESAADLNKGMMKEGSGWLQNFMDGLGIGSGMAAFETAANFVKDFFKGSLEEAKDAARTVNALNQSLEAAGRTDAFNRIIEKGEDMADRFKFLDNDDVTAVFTRIIDYGKLTEHQVNQLIPVIIDFYAKQQLLGNSSFTMAQAGETVIKALEGQGKELKQYGINIKDGSNLTERFNILLTELGAKVKGAGEAFANDLEGQIKSTEQEIKNLQEEIGTKILPLWEKMKVGFLSAVAGMAQGLSYLSDRIEEVFMTQGEKANKLNNRLAAEALQRQKDFAKSFAADAMTKSPAEQKKILEQQKALLKVSEDELKLWDLIDQRQTIQGQQIEAKARQDRLIVEALQEAIGVRNDKRTLGISSPDKTAKEIENRFAEFKKMLADQAKEIDLYNAQQLEKDIWANEQKYEKQYEVLLEALEKQSITIDEFGELMLTHANNRENEQANIIKKWAAEANEKRLEEEKKSAQKLKELDEKRMSQLVANQEKVAKFIAQAADKQLGRLKYSQEVDAFVATGKARLKARLAILERERQEEIKNAKETNRAVADINREYDKKVSDEKLNFFKDRLGTILDYVSQIANSLSQFGQLQNEREEQQLDNDRRANERKKENYRRQLDGKQITQKEYDKKVAELDKQQEERDRKIRVKQFERDKLAALVSATLNIATAITKALPDPFKVALVSAIGAIQLGIIATQKPPKLAKGGKLEGPLHSDGGMPVLNPQTGKKVAEVEGGEVFLSRATVRNNPQLVDQLLYTSMYRNGAPIKPIWKVTNPTYLNIPALNNSLHRVRMYANGGVIDAPAGADSSLSDEIMINLAMAVNRLTNTLDAGINAVVVLSQIQKATERHDAIVNEATMK